MLHLKNISKTFHTKKGSYKALTDIDLQVPKGHILGVIGFSGAGKSTLIRTINLLERPDSGQVIIDGSDLTAASAKQLAGHRKKIGMIFQQFNLLSSRTVFDNVALPLELDHLPKNEIREKVTRLLEIVGLSEKASDYPKSLSGGQKQRVAIARALANDPHLLLCDEATSALDPATTHSILQLLREINGRLGITIVLITHEMDVIKEICHDVAVIESGRLIARGAVEDILGDRENPVINTFLNNENMTLPQSLNARLKPQWLDGLLPVVEIELDGNISFESLISALYEKEKISHKLLKAEIENLGKASFGKILIQLTGDKQENQRAMAYFENRQIHNTIRGYA